MNLIDPRSCVVVLVDYQERLMPAIHRGAEVLAHAIGLADVARELGLRIIATEQNPAGLGHSVAEISRRCDATLSKAHFDACSDGLLDLLRTADGTAPRDVVIAGCEAHVCLLQTALGLRRRGLSVWVVAPACGSRAADNHALAMHRLRTAGAGIVSVEMVAFEWLRSSDAERFKPVLERLKGLPL
ncbi:MAG: isochorismatase family protein [Burkholderiaceae bacterium]